MVDDDIVWYRPAPDTVSPPSVPAAAAAYPGPPVSEPADPMWRPLHRETTTTPRSMPFVDHGAVDEAERRAARLTYGTGLAALAFLLVLACSRTLG